MEFEEVYERRMVEYEIIRDRTEIALKAFYACMNEAAK